MKNGIYTGMAILLLTTAAATAQTRTNCVAGDDNPSSINASCSSATDGLPAISKPLSTQPATNAGSLDTGTTSSLYGGSSIQGTTDGSNSGDFGSSGSVTGSGNADIPGSSANDSLNGSASGTSSPNSRVGGSAITGSSGVSTGLNSGGSAGSQ